MNSSRTQFERSYSALVFRHFAVILLLQANMALAAEPAQSQATPANPQTTQPAPEAPAPAANSTTTLQHRWLKQCSNSSRLRSLRKRLLTCQCPTRATRLHATGPARRPRWISPIRRACRILSAKEKSIFRCATRSLLPSRTIWTWHTSAITSPSRRPIFSVPKQAAPPTALTPASSSPPRADLAVRAAGGGSSGPSFAAGNGGIVTSTLGAGAPVPSFDPYLTFQGYVDHTVDPGGQPVPGRHAGSENQHHRDPLDLLPVVPPRDEPPNQLSRQAPDQYLSIQRHQS